MVRSQASMVKRTRGLVTPRDEEVLTALERVPRTAEQLVKLSVTFNHAFGSTRTVRERLQALGDAGWVRSSRYATTNGGAAPKYYFLSPRGYQLLHGEAASPPKRACLPLPITRHRHTHALAEFVTHLAFAAHKSGIAIENFFRENTLRLVVDAESLFPDSAFELVFATGRRLNFLVEIDCATERVWSPQDTDSWQRKIRLYDRLQDQNAPARFRVLVIATRGVQRLTHILTAAKTLARNPHRALFYGITLGQFLATPDAVTAPCFRDHALRPVSLQASPTLSKDSSSRPSPRHT
jgi:hypothetical protein